MFLEMAHPQASCRNRFTVAACCASTFWYHNGLELEALAEFDVEQPVLIISANPARVLLNTLNDKSTLPSWEWLSASRSERFRSVFAANSADMYGGILDVILLLSSGWSCFRIGEKKCFCG